MSSAATLAIPLSVVLPLGGAGVLAATDKLLPHGVKATVGITVAALSTALVLVTMVTSQSHLVVYWLSGWHPTASGIVLGVDYAVDPLSAALASLAGVLITAALVYSLGYFENVGGRYHALMLVFLAASIDFCQTGDLFNLFVAFELVAVTGFVLTGFNADKQAPLQGAINFAVTNSLAGMAVLLGIGLIYARTGALNLAEIGHVLAGQHADGLVVVAFALLTGGFMVKAAVVPFHFWLPDAYGTAPIPVCVLFSGVMSELGLFAVARIWSTVFIGLSGHTEHRLRFVMLALGIVTAVIGPVMALVQSHLKRMLAFVTVGHVGLYLIGFGLLTPLGLAGASLLVVGDALIKAALFLAVGIVQHRRGSVDEHKLQGTGTGLWLVGVIVALGALVLADAPPFVSSVGKDLLVAGANGVRAGWLELVVAVSVIMSSGAVLRAAGRIWLGWGEADSGQSETEDDPGEDEVNESRKRVPLVMILPPIMLMVLALALGVVPGMGHRADIAATSFMNRSAYAGAILHGTRSRPTSSAPINSFSLSDVITDSGEAIGSLLIAGLALRRRRWGATLRHRAANSTNWLRRLHSGHVGDQVAWVISGLALLAFLSGFALR